MNPTSGLQPGRTKSNRVHRALRRLCGSTVCPRSRANRQVPSRSESVLGRQRVAVRYERTCTACRACGCGANHDPPAGKPPARPASWPTAGHPCFSLIPAHSSPVIQPNRHGIHQAEPLGPERIGASPGVICTAVRRSVQGARGGQPARVLSEVNSRPSSARTAKIPKAGLPEAVLAPMAAPCSLSIFSTMARSVSSWTMVTRWSKSRPAGRVSPHPRRPRAPRFGARG